MQTITKRDIVVRISNETGLTQHEVTEVLQTALDTITTGLAGGESIMLRNFGSFQVRVAKQKVGRNPNKPGADVIIPPRAIVKFRPGKELRDKVAKLLPELRGRSKI